MTPIPFPEQNKVYGPPKNWDAATMGECRDLPVRQVPGAITACYYLNADDCARLDNGAKLYFTIYQDVQPVVGWEIR